MNPQYGNLNNTSNSASKKKKNNAIIAVCTCIAIILIIAVSVVVSKNKSDSSSTDPSPDSSLSRTSKAIKSICEPTDYREQCEKSLTAAAGNVTDPKKLIEASFNVSINGLRDVFNHSTVLQDAAKDPRTQKALQNCNELLDYAIDDLRNSFDHLGALDITKVDDILDDLKVWLGAAVTYQETCLDGFQNTTGDAAASMRKAMTSTQQLTSNALAMVDEISTIFSSFKLPVNRRLLSYEDREHPGWMGSGKRELLATATRNLKPNVVVAQDGSGKFKTINEALPLIPKKNKTPFVIYIKQGVYKENVQIIRSMPNVYFIGDGATKTKITGNLNFVDGTPTFKTATVAVVGDGFMAKNIGFENSAGAAKHQAVALRVQSDKSVFYNCRMDGYQDTLYAHTKRQFYRDCTVTGTIDFIFGDSPTVLQNCILLARKPLPNQQNIVTAQGRKDRREPSALILQNCTFSADPSLKAAPGKTRTFLARPWKEFSRTIIMQSQIDSVIDPEGWLPWAGDFGLRTCFYAEVDNRGPGAVQTKRVKWKGVKKIDLKHAQKFTVESFIQGKQWIQPLGVPFAPGLLPSH